MKRCIYLFLAVSLFICYSGFCPVSVASVKPAPDETGAGCHSMSHSGKDKESGNTDHAIKNSTGDAHSCCYDSLLGASVDHSAKIDHILVHTITIENLNSNSSYSKIAQGRSLREHDPPDLQISNSVFLL